MVSVVSGSSGSSPRMRGAPFLLDTQTLSMRIIPADAGSTAAYYVLEWYIQDHPRGCGEHEVCLISVPVGLGSSPRMRGALHLARVDELDRRIIPADAGSTGRP